MGSYGILVDKDKEIGDINVVTVVGMLWESCWETIWILEAIDEILSSFACSSGPANFWPRWLHGWESTANPAFLDTWLHYYHSLSKTLQNPRVAFGYYNISDPDTPKLPKAFKIQHTLFSWPKVFYFTLSEGPCNPCCWDLSRTLAVSASCDRSQSICANISISTDSPTGHLRSSGISANI